MENLWKKEKKNVADSLYVDLFADSCKEEQFQEWNGKLNNSFWKHRFGSTDIEIRPNKSNDVSHAWRMKGNLIFRDEKLSLNDRWKLSIEFYTKSLIFAEVDTENVSLAYANRSVCFFHLKMYAKCLIDIEYAKKANYPEKLMPKLDKRKADCIRLMQTQIEIKPMYENPALDFPADENFPCMANVVKIKRNCEFGRLLEAKCDIDVGQTVLVEETFVAIGTGEMPAFCFTCLKRNQCFISCSQCTDAVFCSEDCLNRNNIHKMSCGASFHRMSMDMRLSLLSLLVAINTIPNVKDLMDFVEDNLKLDPYAVPTSVLDSRARYAIFLKLNRIKTPLNTLRAYQIYTSLLAIPSINAVFDSSRKLRFLMHLVVHHMVVHKSNGFNDVVGSQFDIASVACVLSLVNHSCAPNLFNFAVNNQEVCVTVRPIKKGEQLSIAYCAQGETTSRRQAALKDKFGFTCNCEKCRPFVLGHSPSCGQMMAHPFVHAMRLRGATGIVARDERVQLRRMCIEFLRKFGHLPWSYEIEMAVDTFKKLILAFYSL